MEKADENDRFIEGYSREPLGGDVIPNEEGIEFGADEEGGVASGENHEEDIEKEEANPQGDRGGDKGAGSAGEKKSRESSEADSKSGEAQEEFDIEEAERAEALDKIYRPMRKRDWLLVYIISCIPGVNLIALLVWSFSKKTNKSKKSFAQFHLIMLLILIGIIAIGVATAYLVFGENFAETIMGYANNITSK